MAFVFLLGFLSSNIGSAFFFLLVDVISSFLAKSQLKERTPRAEKCRVGVFLSPPPKMQGWQELEALLMSANWQQSRDAGSPGKAQPTTGGGFPPRWSWSCFGGV